MISRPATVAYRTDRDPTLGRPSTAYTVRTSDRSGNAAAENGLRRNSFDSDVPSPMRLKSPPSPTKAHMVGYMGYKPQEEDSDEDPGTNLKELKKDCVESHMVGYMGHKRLEYRTGNDQDPRVPIVGYSGWYTGKVTGKLGKIELHRAPLSKKDPTYVEDGEYPQPEGSEDDELEESGSIVNKERRARLIKYREAANQLKHRHISLDALLQDIKLRLEDNFPGLAEKRIHIKQPFTRLDRAQCGGVSATEFEGCLIKLNIVLPWAELTGLLWRFDSDVSGKISYVDFIREVCPQLKW